MQETVVGPLVLGRELGVGGFGTVVQGENKNSKMQVAVKIIDKKTVKEHHLEAYVSRETEMMRKIRHQHVVQLIHVYETAKAFYLEMELASGGELFDKILQQKRFAEHVARKYFQQLISAVNYCHKLGIVHRDLKAENLLLGKDDQLKVCDFGLSRYVVQTKFADHPVMFHSLAGSLDYQAPEVLDQNGYAGFTCDVWSCGVILYFMITGFLPFAETSEDATRRRILNGDYRTDHDALKYLNGGALELFRKIIVVQPERRCSLAQIIEDPWFRTGLDESLFPEHKFQPPATPPPQSPLMMDANHKYQESVSVSSHNLETLKRAFRNCNIDHSGYMTKDQLRDALIHVNHGPVAPEDVDRVMSYFKTDKMGRISEEDFVMGWMKNHEQIDSRMQLSKLMDMYRYDVEVELIGTLRKAFDALDKEHNGFFTAQSICDQPQLGISLEEAAQLIKQLDCTHQHKEGVVTFEDFVLAITKLDLLSKNPVAMRLQRINEVFDAADHRSCLALLNKGFTVAGLREFIVKKLQDEGPRHNTSFRETNERGYLQASYKDTNGRSLEVGLQLTPAFPGYTRVIANRLGGRTEVFHEWFRQLRHMLHREIQQCAEDTSPRGESEYM